MTALGSRRSERFTTVIRETKVEVRHSAIIFWYIFTRSRLSFIAFSVFDFVPADQRYGNFFFLGVRRGQDVPVAVDKKFAVRKSNDGCRNPLDNVHADTVWQHSARLRRSLRMRPFRPWL